MIICVDCDNVLCNLQEVVINIFNAKYDKTYVVEDFKNYNIAECLDREEATNMKALYSESGIYDLVKPLSGAQNALQKLIRAGHEVYIVTHSMPCIFEEKSKWIKYHFPMIDDAHIVAMQHKWLFKCDIMIEDNLDNLLGAHHYDRVLFDLPWNRDIFDEAYGIHRVRNWNDALVAIDNIDKMWSDIV